MTDSARGYREGPRGEPQRGSDASTDPLLDSLSRRWRMQTHMITAAAWMRAVAIRAASLRDVAVTIPSALQTHDAVDAFGGHRRETTHLHRLITDSFAQPITDHRAQGSSSSDAWTQLLTELAAHASSAKGKIHLLLPRPGDTRGLTGESLEMACAHGAAVDVVTHGRHHVIVAVAEHEGLVTWSGWTDSVAVNTGASIKPDQVREADRHLRESIVQAEAVLSDIGHRGLGATYRSQLERHLRFLLDSSLPRSSEAVHLPELARAIGMAWTTDLALANESPVITISDAEERRRILLELDRAARRAVEASLTSTAP